jgi:hypothetical protein
MPREQIVPIEWEDYVEGDVESSYMFFNVTFYKPFASIKKIGTAFPQVYVDYGGGFLETYDEDGNALSRITFIGVPIAEEQFEVDNT